MSDDNKLSYDQLHALTAHLQTLLNTLTATNNELIMRLTRSPTFTDGDRDTLNEWSRVTNEIHTASDAHIMEIRSRPAPQGRQ